MKIAVMQPYLFPYIRYFQLIAAVDKFVIYDDVNFIKRGWINRNNILVNGKAHLFTVPLKEASQNKLIHEIYLSPELSWKKNFIKTIEINYKQAPFYAQVFPLIESIVMSRQELLVLYIINSLEEIMHYLELDVGFVPSSGIYANNMYKGQDRIIDICRQEKADHYINLLGGIELYDQQEFIHQHINLSFLSSEAIPYKQFNEKFVPWLSIIDILMFNSKECIQGMLKNFTLLNQASEKHLLGQ